MFLHTVLPSRFRGPEAAASAGPARPRPRLPLCITRRQGPTWLVQARPPGRRWVAVPSPCLHCGRREVLSHTPTLTCPDAHLAGRWLR